MFRLLLLDHPGGESVTVLVGREKRTMMMIAHVVPFKGGGVDWLVGQLLRDLRKWVLTERSFSKATKRTPSWMCSTTSVNRGEKRTSQQ